MKLFPTYQLSIEVGPFDKSGNATEHLEIYPPYSVDFEIRREYLAAAQTASITVHQLGEETRNRIYKDRYATTQYAAIQFRAGYVSQGGFLPLIFNGTLRWAYSERTGSGATDFKTVLECYDGGFQMANGYTSRTVYAGATLADTLRALNSDLPKIYPTPVIGNFPTTSYRGQALFGQPFKLINDMIPPGSSATIDNGQLKVLQDNEIIQINSQEDVAQIPLISSDTGLLAPPIRSGALIVCPIMFEPRVGIGLPAILKSSENKLYNGLKKIMGFKHRGMISGGLDASGRFWPAAVDGERVTELSLWQGTAALNPVVGTTPQ